MEKNYTISLIRFISMVMIISCHILQGLDNKWAFWINVGVQIFFLMSGYLYGNKKIEIVKFYKSRIKKILIPYMILAIIILLIEFIYLKKQYDVLSIIASVFGFGGIYGNSEILSHTWFVTYILIGYMLLPIFQKIFDDINFKESFKRLVILVVFLQLLEIFKVVNFNVCWINNLLFGYYYSKCCKENKEKNFIKILSIVLFVIIIPFAVILQEKLFKLPQIFNKYSIYIMNYGHVFLGIFLFIILYSLLNKINIRKSIFLDLSDKYSYYIYLVHQIFILFAFSLLHITSNLILNIVLILLSTIVSAIILKFICDMLFKLTLKKENKNDLSKIYK